MRASDLHGPLNDLFPVGYIADGRPPKIKADNGRWLDCDGSFINPDEFPLLSAVLESPRTHYRHHFWRWRWGRYETRWPFGVNRLPELYR